MKTILALVVLGLVILFLLMKKPRTGGSARKNTSASRTAPARGRQGTTTLRKGLAGRPFRATSIKPGSGACAAAREVAGQRFLLSDVPNLPLAGCTAARCDCRYGHHEDRRDPAGERRAPAGLGTELYSQSGRADRRSSADSGGRRASD